MITWRHKLPEWLWDDNALCSLVVFQNSTYYTGSSTHGCIEHVHELSLAQKRLVIIILYHYYSIFSINIQLLVLTVS